MSRRSWIVAVTLAPLVVATLACNKSEGSKPPALFGAPPEVSEVLMTKERRHFECTSCVDLCCVDPPDCTCCCIADTCTEVEADKDLITVTARVRDPDGAPDILVVVLRFLDPPLSTVPPGTQVNQISLEMFDSGPQPDPPLGHVTAGSELVQVLSGDQTAGDGIYTRKFYFSSSTTQNAGNCVPLTDRDNFGGTFSDRGTSATIDPDNALPYLFNTQAFDREGNLDTSDDTPLPIQGTFVQSQTGLQRPCGPASGNGGCLPGP